MSCAPCLAGGNRSLGSLLYSAAPVRLLLLLCDVFYVHVDTAQTVGLGTTVDQYPLAVHWSCQKFSPGWGGCQDSRMLTMFVRPTKTPQNTTEARHHVLARREKRTKVPERERGRKGDREHDGGRHLSPLAASGVAAGSALCIAAFLDDLYDTAAYILPLQ